MSTVCVIPLTGLFPSSVTHILTLGGSHLGQLERIPDLLPVQIEDAIRNYKLVPEADIGPAADFIRACLKLDPEERLSAEKLREHPWLEKVVLYN